MTDATPHTPHKPPQVGDVVAIEDRWNRKGVRARIIHVTPEWIVAQRLGEVDPMPITARHRDIISEARFEELEAACMQDQIKLAAQRCTDLARLNAALAALRGDE